MELFSVVGIIYILMPVIVCTLLETSTLTQRKSRTNVHTPPPTHTHTSARSWKFHFLALGLKVVDRCGIECEESKARVLPAQETAKETRIASAGCVITFDLVAQYKFAAVRAKNNSKPLVT